MSSSTSCTEATSVPVEEIYQGSMSSSSSDPPSPMEQWSITLAPKMTLFKDGLYDPGSGEICTKYLPMSSSSVNRHVYFNYPSINDPGIEDALFQPEKIKVYEPDGQELYLDLCAEMKIIPVRSFHRGLLERDIDLGYYCVNPVGVRAMSLALMRNTVVKHLNLTSNFLTDDACYHLGQLLAENVTLQELVLAGCKIRPSGLRRLVNRLSGRSLDLLDLSGNALGDEGFFLLADQLAKGAIIKRLRLRNNELGSQSGSAFAAAIESFNKFTHLDLSWNRLYPPKGIGDLLRMLGENTTLVELNLSWNGLNVSAPLKKILAIPTLKQLDLSNNRISTPSVQVIISNLRLARKLQTLNLSNNPLTMSDAFLLLTKMKQKEVMLKNLLMDNVTVKKEFKAVLKEVMALNYRKQCTITYGKVIHDYTLSTPDIRQIVLKRLCYITESAPKCTLDLPSYFLTVVKEGDVFDPRRFMRDLKNSGAPSSIDWIFIDQVCDCFPGPSNEKGDKTLSLNKVVDFVRRLWPDARASDSAVPAQEPEEPPKKGKK